MKEALGAWRCGARRGANKMASWPVGGDQSGRGGGAHNQSLAYLPLPTRHFNEPSIAVLAWRSDADPPPLQRRLGGLPLRAPKSSIVGRREEMSAEDEGLERGIRSGRCSDVIHLIPRNITEWRAARSLSASLASSLAPRSASQLPTHSHSLFFSPQQQLLYNMTSTLPRL